jgi:hypothetical protein
LFKRHDGFVGKATVFFDETSVAESEAMVFSTKRRWRIFYLSVIRGGGFRHVTSPLHP